MTATRKQENKERASWARKDWIIWQYASNAANIVLLNDCIKSKIFNDFLKEYKNANEFWNVVCNFTSIGIGIEKLIFDNSPILQINNGYNTFAISWSTYKTRISVADLSSEDKEAIRNIDEFISFVNSQIKKNE